MDLKILQEVINNDNSIKDEEVKPWTESASVINYLPNELKIKLCHLLRTYDVLVLSRFFPYFECCLYEKSVMKLIDLSFDFRVDINDYNFLFRKPRLEMITHLNLNGLFWIPAGDIRACIKKMENLECFYALDTKFTINDCLYFRSGIVRKLALTVPGDDIRSSGEDYLTVFHRTLTHLYLHFKNNSIIVPIFNLVFEEIHFLYNLQELHIVDFCKLPYRSNFLLLLFPLAETLKDITIYFNCEANNSVAQSIRSSFGTTIFLNEQGGIETKYERFEKNADLSNIYRQEYVFEDFEWHFLKRDETVQVPFCAHDAYLLITKQESIHTIQLQELNLRCEKEYDILTVNNARRLLEKPNMKYLKKLSITLSFLVPHDLEEKNPTKEPLFKRIKRKSKLEVIKDTCDILNRFEYLEELELWGCHNNCGLTDSSLKELKQLKNLKKLTVQGLSDYITGEFLIEVCTSCKYLESLRIQLNRQLNKSRSIIMNKNICSALESAKSLKDLYYEYTLILFDELFECLSSNENSRLERFSLKCKSVKTFSISTFTKFMNKCSKLRFLCIAVELPVIVNIIKKELKKFKDPRKIFLIAKDFDEPMLDNDVPNLYKHEMLQFRSHICTLNYFDLRF